MLKLASLGLFTFAVLHGQYRELLLPEARTVTSSVQRAAAEFRCSVELIVVDNASADRTAEIAKASGARVVCESVHNIARVRNAGAATAHGEVLVFVEADTTVPHEFLDKVRKAMTDPVCLGGSAGIVRHVRSKILGGSLSHAQLKPIHRQAPK